MAHFAEIDSNLDNVVLRVLVIGNDDILDENGEENEAIGIAYCKSLFGEETEWVQTSYNNNFRKNYAGIGYTYDATRDAFISVKPYPSWTLNEDTCQWDAPVPYPRTEEDDDPGLEFLWKEDILNWVVKVGQRGLAVDDPGDTSWIDGMSPEQIAQGKIDGNYSPIRWISDTEYVPLVKEK